MAFFEKFSGTKAETGDQHPSPEETREDVLKRAELSDRAEQVKALSCSTCRKETFKTDKYCIGCGASFLTTETNPDKKAEQVDGLICSRCRKQIESTDNFCIYCGRTFLTDEMIENQSLYSEQAK